ncbi:hypothetical protein HQ563_04205 [bacterium]|nr:hypothetical protein [bacterium]
MSLRRALFTIALVGLLGSSLGLNAAEEAEGLGMTHTELAQAIVRALGLQSDLPVNATPADYGTYLQGKGIAPLRGWIPGADVTKDDLAVVTVEALGLAGEVENAAEVDSYMAVLDERDISLATVMDVVRNVTVGEAITELVLYSPIAVLYETFLSPVEAR